MAGSKTYARHDNVRCWASVVIVSLFLACVGLYGLPIAVLLAFLASAAYCGVCYISFTVEGRVWRRALERSYDKLFTAVRGSDGQAPGERARGGRLKQDRDARQVSLKCHKEAQKMIHLIMRDFVHEWYQNMSTQLEFTDDCKKVLEHVALEINIRVQQMDLDEVVYELLTATLPYLEAVNRAGKLEFNGVEIFDICHERSLRRFEEDPSVAHRALRSVDTESRYYRQLLDAVIQSALPLEYQQCDLVCMFLRELLLQNIFEPTLSLVCDPDFLNKAIPIILKKADPVEVQIVLDNIQEENKLLEHMLIRGRVISAHRRPPNRRRFHSMSDHYPMTVEPNSVQLRPRSHRYVTRGETIPGGVVKGAEFGEVDLGEECVGNVAEEEEEGRSVEVEGGGSEEGEVGGSVEGEWGQSCNSGHIVGVSSTEIEVRDMLPFSSSLDSCSTHDDDTRRKGALPSLGTVQRSLPQRQTGVSNSQHPPTVSKQKSVAMVPSLSLLETDEDLVYIDLPPIFATHYVHIHQGGSTYIGYVFKFPKTMLSAKDLQELGLPGDETHLESVKRYSDFTRLQQQLQKMPVLLKHAQGLGLPERHGFANVVSKLPFTSRDLDPTALLERKQGLEKYIQLISSRPDILESRLFQEFLKSGVLLLQKVNASHPSRSRHKRSFLGIVKGHSTDGEEAKPLPKRPMESVISSYLNTNLPLPCRNLNTTGNSVVKTGKTGLTANGDSHRDRRKPVLVKAATISDDPSSTSSRELLMDDREKRRTASLSDAETKLTTGAGDNLPIETEYNCIKTSSGQVDECDGYHGNDVNSSMDTVGTTQSWRHSHFLVKTKDRLIRLFSTVWYCIHSAVAIVRQCSLPLTHDTLETLTDVQKSDNPLSDILLSLGTEASQSHCEELWVTDRSTQLAVLTLLGGAIDRFLKEELRVVVEKEENWVRILYRLRHTLWVEGAKEFERSPRETLTNSEREERKRMAVNAFKKFLPNILPYVVGSEDYDHAVTHCLECLQNPRINRHYFLRIIDILLPKLVPELHSDELQKRLARLRTLTSTHAHGVPHSRSSSSTYSKKH